MRRSVRPSLNVFARQPSPAMEEVADLEEDQDSEEGQEVPVMATVPPRPQLAGMLTLFVF